MHGQVALKPRLRIPDGMVRVHVSPADAPTEILPALEDSMAGGEVRRSGEYKVSPETEALIKSVKEAAVAETRRDLAIESMVKEMAENTRATDRLAGDVTETNRVLATVVTTQDDHGRQLAAMWDEKKSKNSAWHSLLPTIVGSLISALLLAMMAMSGAFQGKEAAAVAAPPAPKTTPAP